REEESAFAIEVPGDGIEGDEEPGRETAERLRAGADPSVGDRGGGRGEIPRQPPDLARRNPGPRRDAGRREPLRCLLQEGKPVRKRLQVPEIDAPFLEEHVE